MTLLLHGKSICSLCGQVIKETEAVYCFPAFVTNELDPCYFFSDAAFHEVCLKQHPHGVEAIDATEEWYTKTGPGKRKCVVCREEVTDPDDYFLLGYLSGQKNAPLHEFNYTHLHKSCLPNWGERLRFAEIAKAVLASGAWKETFPCLGKIINELQQVAWKFCSQNLD